jgi:alkylhydroperoxidase/carboxymuconolactone decarboxylase family protein YurZ
MPSAKKSSVRKRPAKKSTDIERELERLTQLRGFRHGLHEFHAQMNGAEWLKKHNDQFEAKFLKENPLDRKTKELALIVACVCLKASVSQIQLHMHTAHKCGATPEEILALMYLLTGAAGSIIKIRGFEAWRATFRPDIPTLYRVVELR